MQLHCIHPDGTIVPFEYIADNIDVFYEQLDARPFQIVRCARGLFAIIDDEGMLNGSRFNVPASFVLHRPLWGRVIPHRISGTGFTHPIEDVSLDTFKLVASIWRRLVIEAADSLGQDIITTANADTLPPPTIINLDTGEQIQ